MSRRIFTIGHSTRDWADFVKILAAHQIKAVADVRRYPGSRRYPQFNAEAMAKSLPESGIEYLPFKALGGRRTTSGDSPNTGWRNAAFRGYADFMQTPEFLDALASLQKAAELKPTAIMCAEAVPWRCHRSLIADALLVRGWEVLDIYDERQVRPHELTDFAVVSEEKIVYPQRP